MSYTFAEASAFVMPFGKHKDHTLDDIAATDDGLRYLDWLRGERAGCKDRVDRALDAYLSDETIAKDLAALAKEQR